MRHRTRAALYGVAIGIGLVVFCEFMGFWIEDRGFFETAGSWGWLAGAAVVFAFLQVRAYDKKKGIYADREAVEERPSPVGESAGR